MQPNFLRQAAAPKSDQLNADDLIGGIEKIIKITRVHDSGSSEQRVCIFYEGDNGKPWKPCKSMIRVLLNCWGDDEKLYVGRCVLLIRDDTVTWAGSEVGGIRVKALSHIKGRMRFNLTKTRNNKAPCTVEKLEVEDKPVASEALIQKCKDAAKKGTAHYATFWPTLSSDEKVTLRPYREEFKSIADEADTAIAADGAAQSEADAKAYAEGAE